MQDIAAECKNHNLTLHLDGARVFNAIVAEGYTAADLGKIFDSISICLSKGLGAPVGSVLIGKRDFIQQAIRVRKVFGGGMRQAGYMAACGFYALQHHVQRLEMDHEHTKQVAGVLDKAAFVQSMLPVQTNIIIFKLTDEKVADAFQTYLKSQGILANKVSPDSMRFVFHLDISEQMVNQLIEVIASYNYQPLVTH
jgi:threonine aldolase